MKNPNTNSIASPEPQAESYSGRDSCFPAVSPALTETASLQLESLECLEALMLASQRALLAHDVSLLEQLTAQQAQLQRALSALAERDPAHGARAAPTSRASSTPVHASVPGALRAAQCRVSRLGRIQQVLLARAQASLHVLANCLAGPHASYEPVGGSTGLALRPAAPRHRLRSEEA